uniref:Uncharacterized protein n=1 Tax=Anguilla anguilla TaxID=7936 RepID=A0A0E9PD10_ANGAN
MVYHQIISYKICHLMKTTPVTVI